MNTREIPGQGGDMSERPQADWSRGDYICDGRYGFPHWPNPYMDEKAPGIGDEAREMRRKANALRRRREGIERRVEAEVGAIVAKAAEEIELIEAEESVLFKAEFKRLGAWPIARIYVRTPPERKKAPPARGRRGGKGK